MEKFPDNNYLGGSSGHFRITLSAKLHPIDLRRLKMLTTRFTELVGCTVPIQQAGMGFFAHPPLAKAVAKAGGLGMVSVYANYGGSPDNIARLLDTTQV